MRTFFKKIDNEGVFKAATKQTNKQQYLMKKQVLIPTETVDCLICPHRMDWTGARRGFTH